MKNKSQQNSTKFVIVILFQESKKAMIYAEYFGGKSVSVYKE